MRIFLCHFLYNFVKENINRARCPQRKTPSSLSRTFPTRREQGRVTAQDAFMHPALKRRLRDRRLSAGTPSAAPVKNGRPCRVAEGASVKVRKGIGKGGFIPGVRAGKHRGSPEAGRKVPKHREVPGGRGECRSRFRAPAGKRPHPPGRGRGNVGKCRDRAGHTPEKLQGRPAHAPERSRKARRRAATCRSTGKRRKVPGRPGGSPGG